MPQSLRVGVTGFVMLLAVVAVRWPADTAIFSRVSQDF
jgi:hypothetical protein